MKTNEFWFTEKATKMHGGAAITTIAIGGIAAAAIVYGYKMCTKRNKYNFRPNTLRQRPMVKLPYRDSLRHLTGEWHPSTFQEGQEAMDEDDNFEYERGLNPDDFVDPSEYGPNVDRRDELISQLLNDQTANSDSDDDE